MRLLPFELADGPQNMAADEVMLESALAGVASVRLYGWSPATLSLGYFQKHAERLADPKLASMPWVRRPTGGGAIVHDRDLTYAVALPAALSKMRAPEDWHCQIHRALTECLRRRRIAAEVQGGERLPPHALAFLCFAVGQPGDILLGGEKIVGGAQRLRHGALMQHGSIQFPAADALAENLGPELVQALGWTPCPAPWSDAERRRIQELASEKYRSHHWNCKR